SREPVEEGEILGDILLRGHRRLRLSADDPRRLGRSRAAEDEPSGREGDQDRAGEEDLGRVKTDFEDPGAAAAKCTLAAGFRTGGARLAQDASPAAVASCQGKEGSATLIAFLPVCLMRRIAASAAASIASPVEA